MTTINFRITGMHCASCKALIEDVAPEVPGVRTCVVDLEGGLATLDVDEAIFRHEAFETEVAALGDYTIEAL